MISKKPLVAAVDIANRFHAANFQNFSKRFNLDAAVRNGMAMCDVRMQLDAAKMGARNER